MELVLDFYNEHPLFFKICGILFVAYYLIIFLASDFFHEKIKNIYTLKSNSKNLYKFDENQREVFDSSKEDLSDDVLDLGIEMDQEVIEALEAISKQSEQLSVDTELDHFLKQTGINLNKSDTDDDV